MSMLSEESAMRLINKITPPVRSANGCLSGFANRMDCPTMRGRENDTSMTHEHYDCKRCGGHIALDYEEMR